jgi:tetratricopeptide (TPR) repeat protein
MKTLIKALVLAGAAIWVYGPCLNGTWLWDDGLEVTQNAALRDPGGWWRVWIHPEGMDYFPLKGSVQWLEWHLWGAEPLGYHLVNLGLHVASALLVWRLLHLLGIRAAFFGGLLFAVHPLAVESVAWISELKNTLSLPPLLLSSIAIVAFYRSGSRSSWVAALLCFAAALACKTSVVMFPFVILLFAWWRKGRVTLRDLRKTAPFFAASLAMGAATLWFQSTRAIGSGGAREPLPARFAEAGFSIFAYLRQAFWPSGLAPIYPPLAGTVPAWIPWLAIATGLGACWWWRARWGRHALLGLGWFLLNLVPVLGILPMSYSRISPRADHLAYLPLVGLIGLAAAFVGEAHAWLAKRAGAGGPLRMAFAAAGTVAVVLLASESRSYAAVFRDERSLWTSAVDRNPQAWLAHNNLGKIYLEDGRPGDAARELGEAVGIRQDSEEAHANLGNALEALGRGEEARAQYRAALEIEPGFAGAHYNLGLSLLRAGNPTEAAGEFQAALRAEPGRAGARNGLGLSLAALGQLDSAAGQYRLAIAADPGLKEAHLNLGNTLFRQGRMEEAVTEYRQALRIDPDYAGAHYNLGQALSRLGRQSEAAAELGAARGTANH